jgi:hypothetical protein
LASASSAARNSGCSDTERMVVMRMALVLLVVNNLHRRCAP